MKKEEIKDTTKVTEKATKDTTKVITKKIEGEAWETAKEEAYKKANKKAKIDGFRQGKAPKDVFLKKYGEESLWADAADMVLEKAYEEMLKENEKEEIVARPEVGVKSLGKDAVEFTFTLTLKPELKLGKYKGLKVKKEEVKVEKEEIAKTIEEMRSRYTENAIKEGKVADGDTVVIDFLGTKDGVAFEGGTAENYSLKIGSNTFIPGFEEQLIGMEKEEVKDVNVTFPEDYHAEDLKGAPVVFKVTVHEIKEAIVPEIDKDFFEDLGLEGVDSVESLEKVVEENIRTQKEANADNKYLDDLLAEAAKEVEVEVPHAMIHDEIDRMMDQYAQNLQMQGLTLEQFYQFTNSNEDALRGQMHEEAEKRVLYRLMLEEIAKAEKIEVSDAVAKEEAKKLADKYKMEEEEFLKAFGGLDMIKYDRKMRDAMEVLKG
ncbi:MAG: trigger factor [Bacilli bacterium]|nr:trigger factor [Bacilli bacterium]